MKLPKWINKKEETAHPEELPSDQAVIAVFNFPEGLSDREILQHIYDLEDELDDSLQRNKVGDCDGHELGDGEVIMYMYGTDADKVYEIAEPILGKVLSKPVHVTLRYGKAADRKAKEVRRLIK